jgi:hypothetical protein
MLRDVQDADVAQCRYASELLLKDVLALYAERDTTSAKWYRWNGNWYDTEV